MAHYFDFREADPRDTVLKAAKKTGVVPDTCLLNGNIVMGLHYESKDPCAYCPGPRERCGGRPMIDPKSPPEPTTEANKLSYADDATYRALDRKRKLDILDSLMIKSRHD